MTSNEVRLAIHRFLGGLGYRLKDAADAGEANADDELMDCRTTLYPDDGDDATATGLTLRLTNGDEFQIMIVRMRFSD